MIPANTDDTDDNDDQADLVGGNSNPDEGDPDDAKKTVSVTLNANGGLFDNGEDTYVITVEENSSFSDLVVTPALFGFTFTGWYSDAEATSPVDIDTFTAVDGAVLYAGYEERLDLLGSGNENITVTFDLNLDKNPTAFFPEEGQNSTSPRKFKTNAILDIGDVASANPGYILLGFSTENDAAEPDEGFEVYNKKYTQVVTFYDIRFLNTDELTEDTTYYAVWNKKYSVITFDATEEGSFPVSLREGGYYEVDLDGNGNHQYFDTQRMYGLSTGWKVDTYTTMVHSPGDTPIPKDESKRFTDFYTEDGKSFFSCEASNYFTEDMTFYARYEKIPVTTTVSFDTNSEGEVEALAPIQVTAGKKYPVEMAVGAYEPTRAGYEFGGWYTDKTYRTRIKGGVTTVPEDIPEEGITLYAKWTDVPFTVNFHSNLSKDTKKTVTYKMSQNATTLLDPQAIFGKSIVNDQMAENFEKWIPSTGDFSFTSQQKVSDLISKYAEENTKGTIDLYAQWKDGAPYTVKFNAGEVADFDAHDFLGSDFYVTSDNDLIRYETVYPDQKLALTGHEFVRKGYTLTGWSYVAANGKKTTIKPTATVVNLAKSGETVELTAIWKGPESYTLSYDLAGGKYTGAGKLPGKYTYANPYVLPDASEMTKTGYTFRGWTAKIGDNNYSTTTLGKGGQIESGNVKLTAWWTTNRYDFVLDPNGGWISINEKYVQDGRKPWKTEDFGYDDSWFFKGVQYSRPGYKFQNLSYVDDNGNTKTIAGNGTITRLTQENGKTVTLTANWTPLNYTISYNIGSGAKMQAAPKSYKGDIIGDGSDLAISVEPTRTGYNFKEWILTNKNSNETAVLKKLDSGDYTLESGSFGNVTLTAVWTPAEYTFEINGSDGENVTPDCLADKKYSYDTTIDFTRTAGDISVLMDDGKSVKGFALSAKDAAKGTVKYALGKNFKISDIVKATKATDKITLYAVTEKEKFFLNAYNSVDGNRDNGSYRTYNYDQSRDYKVPTPSLTGFTFEGWSYLDRDTVKDLSELAIAGTDYVVDAKTKALTIKKHINSSDPFKNATLVAVFETKTYKVILVPNAKDVKADNTENATVVPNAGVVFTVGENDLVSHSDDSAVLSGIEWSRSGYTLKGFSLTSKGAILDGGVNAKVGGLFSKADRNGNVKLYAIWDANTITVTYHANANVFADTDDIKGKSDGDYARDASLIIHALNNNEDKEYTYGKAITPPTYKISGYKFLGWKLEGTNPNVTINEKTGYVTKINANNTEDVVLTPELEEITYKLSLNPNGGKYNDSNKTIVLKDKVRFSEDIADLLPGADSMDRVGYELYTRYYNGTHFGFVANAGSNYSNWLDSKRPLNGTIILGSTKAVTLYPQWTKISVTVPNKVSAEFRNGILNMFWGDTGYGNSGYEVQYSTNPLFLYSVTSETVDGTTFSLLKEGLTGTKYYIRVRGIKKDSAEADVKGSWSSVVSAAADYTSYQLLRAAYVVGDNVTPVDTIRRAADGQSLLQALGTPSYKAGEYKFYGWFTDEDCNEGSRIKASDRADAEQIGNVYYAKFIPVNDYKLSFVIMFDDGETDNPDDITVTYGQPYGKLPEITRKGCEFEGWYISGTNTRVTEDTIVSTAEDHTLYAKWLPRTYKINFDANAPADTTVTGNMAVLSRQSTEIKALPANAYKATGYKFVGWKISQDSEWLIADKAKIKPEHLLNQGATADADNNITVYAQWEPIEYTLTLNIGHNKRDQVIKAHYGENTLSAIARSVNLPEITGYSFGFWFTHTTTSPFDTRIGENDIVTGNKTYYAYWILQLYNVHFDLQDGSDITVVDQKYGTNIYSIMDAQNIPKNPTQEGATFGGWYMEEESGQRDGKGEKVNANTTLPNHNVTYYAYWIPVQ